MMTKKFSAVKSFSLPHPQLTPPYLVVTTVLLTCRNSPPEFLEKEEAEAYYTTHLFTHNKTP